MMAATMLRAEMTPGRTAEDRLPTKLGRIWAIAMDMSPAYVKGASDYFPQARIVFDKFHLMVLAGQAKRTPWRA